MVIFNTYGGLLVRKQCHNVEGMKSRNWHAGTETLHPDTKFAPPPHTHHFLTQTIDMKNEATTSSRLQTEHSRHNTRQRGNLLPFHRVPNLR